MKKIKTKIIHLLGGYTRDEYNKARTERFDEGVASVCASMFTLARNSWGMSAEQWCTRMYAYIETMYTQKCH